jgi:hypothetical protein
MLLLEKQQVLYNRKINRFIYEQKGIFFLKKNRIDL